MGTSSNPVDPTGAPKTILIVDDDVEVLTLVCNILHGGRHDIMRANSGADAVEKSNAFAGTIDLLLSDFQMPGMTGIELALELTRKHPKLKVLMMSGFTDGMLVLNEGWHFLAKPFVASQLRSLVTGLLFPDNSRFQ